jgi:hypothetical protein
MYVFSSRLQPFYGLKGDKSLGNCEKEWFSVMMTPWLGQNQLPCITINHLCCV